MRVKTLSILAAASLACATQAWGQAPQPAKPVDLGRLYSGRWLEVARTPMGLTKGCVAGATNYLFTGGDQVLVRDTCEVGAPGGREKAIEGRGKILDPGVNTKLRVRYPFLITWDYWILDHDDDYAWFIAGDPRLKRIFIFTRDVPSPDRRVALVKRVQALGYDMAKIEFPAQPPLKAAAPARLKP